MIDPDSDLHRLTPTALQLAAYAEHRLRGAELQFVELWLVRHPVVLEDVLHARLAWMDGDLGPVEWITSDSAIPARERERSRDAFLNYSKQ